MQEGVAVLVPASAGTPGRLRVGLALGFGVAVLSSASILIKKAEAPSLVIAAGRLLVASLVLAPFFWIRFPKLRSQLGREKWSLVVLAGLLLAAHFALWVESLRHTTVASSVVLVATDPIFVAVASPLILHERVSGRLATAVGLGVVGMMVIAGPGLWSGLVTRGNLLALGGAACAAGYLLVGRRVRPEMDLLPYIYILYSVAGVLLLAGTLAARQRFTGYPGTVYLWIVLLGLGPQLIGHTTFNWALRYLNAPAVGMAILGEPVGATILAWLLLRETPAWFELTGGAIILAAVYLAIVSRHRLQVKVPNG
ncbi:MAG: DMT family transporter [candidate division WOR-3 bacterium]